jgi:hypothetical protein
MTRKPLTTAMLAIGLAGLVATAAFAVTVKSDYDKNADFSKYKSFSIKKGTEAPTPFAQERIIAAVKNELKARGMSESDNPDIFVYTHAKVSTEKRVDVTNFGYGGYPGWGGWGGSWGTSTAMVTDVPMGTLIVDIVDAKSTALVWRGIGSDTLLTNPTPEKSEKRINKGVAKLFTKYPVQPGEKKEEKKK